MNKAYGEKNKKPITPNFEHHDKIKFKIKTIQKHKEEKEQKPSKLRDLLKSIPIIGELLARTFTSEKIKIISNPIYDKKEEVKTTKTDGGHIERVVTKLDERYKQLQSERASKTDGEHTEGTGSKLEEVMLKESKKKNHGLTK